MKHDLPDPTTAANIHYQPSFETLRSLSAEQETETEFGSPSYVTGIRSRSADRTTNTVDDQLTNEDRQHLDCVRRRLREDDHVCLDRQLGRHPALSFRCRLFVPAEHARIALGWAKLLEPVSGDEPPDFQTVQLPDWRDVRIRIFPEDGITYVLGSDYTGEAKKSFLRLFMYRAKQQGGLGLHAGAKRVTLQTEKGDPQTIGQLFLGLSATGKTTLTCHGLWLEDPERAELVQDDVCALLTNGSVVGSEGGGLFIKTQDLSEDEQPELFHAVCQPDAVLENVLVDPDGTVHFDDDELTGNGRAIVLRSALPNAAQAIDLNRAHHVFFITRNPLMPPVARLTPEEGAAAFMLGESIETSAGDPARAGESVRVVGTNPFVIGSPGEEGNRFLELVRTNDIDCFLLNTGEVGGEKPIRVEDTIAILTAISRGEISWHHDERVGLMLATQMTGLDIAEFYPPDYVEDYETRLENLHIERREYLLAFEDLDETILETGLVAPDG